MESLNVYVLELEMKQNLKWHQSKTKNKIKTGQFLAQIKC